MTPTVVLKLKGGYLRPLLPEDVHPGYVSGLNDPEVNRYLEVRHAIQTTQSVVDFVIANKESDNSVLWGVWQYGSERHCGTARLHSIDYNQMKAYIGVCLFDKTTWGTRLGSGAIDAVTRWALDVLEMHWVEAGVYAKNIASQKAFLSVGYEWVCDVPDRYILEGKPTTVKIYAARKQLNFELESVIAPIKLGKG